VSNPAAPLLVGSVDTAGIAYEVTVQNNLAFVNGDSGLEIIDVSNPTVNGFDSY
jgi:hypothetical protein